VIDRKGILPKQPLFYVLTSLRFQPWMMLPNKIAEIQDALRDRLPLVNQVMIGNMGAGGAEVSSRPVAWAFHTANRSAGCQVSMDQIVVHATAYTRFDDFAELARFVISAVEVHARQLDIGSIGIRYLDKIAPRSGETLADYLPAEYLPKDVPGRIFSPVNGLSQTTYRTETGVLQARFWCGENHVTVPDDLVPLFILTQDFGATGPVLTPLEPNNGILDSDSIWTSQTPVRMGADQVIEKLRALHTHSNEFFRNICSEHAFKAWRGES
jgi:uncharacterized protein (TIGR04255 family)